VFTGLAIMAPTRLSSDVAPFKVPLTKLAGMEKRMTAHDLQKYPERQSNIAARADYGVYAFGSFPIGTLPALSWRPQFVACAVFWGGRAFVRHDRSGGVHR
jgi:hypothetical protein